VALRTDDDAQQQHDATALQLAELALQHEAVQSSLAATSEKYAKLALQQDEIAEQLAIAEQLNEQLRKEKVSLALQLQRSELEIMAIDLSTATQDALDKSSGRRIATDETKMKARELRQQGYTLEAIAKELGYHKTSVGAWLSVLPQPTTHS
jgi:hypothetical protein